PAMTQPAEPTPSAEFIGHVTRAQRTLYAFILSLLCRPEDAEDVLQETNVVLWTKAGEFDASREFLPWALRIAQLQAMAHRKRHAQRRWVFDDTLLASIADQAARQADASGDGRRSALVGCLRKLPDDQRQLVARRYEPGGSVNQLAEQRGVSPKALSESLRRIRRTLLQCIERTLAREAQA
ncbi:MAG: sigma-70 family RNA polymerase sigma factor, partial [Planctomycetales bacterium]|nr:sigma-70 family RNA polymerase sigma factor [Planctomycetales bacterium]